MILRKLFISLVFFFLIISCKTLFRAYIDKDIVIYSNIEYSFSDNITLKVILENYKLLKNFKKDTSISRYLGISVNVVEADGSTIDISEYFKFYEDFDHDDNEFSLYFTGMMTQSLYGDLEVVIDKDIVNLEREEDLVIYGTTFVVLPTIVTNDKVVPIIGVIDEFSIDTDYEVMILGDKIKAGQNINVEKWISGLPSGVNVSLSEEITTNSGIIKLKFQGSPLQTCSYKKLSIKIPKESLVIGIADLRLEDAICVNIVDSAESQSIRISEVVVSDVEKVKDSNNNEIIKLKEKIFDVYFDGCAFANMKKIAKNDKDDVNDTIDPSLDFTYYFSVIRDSDGATVPLPYGIKVALNNDCFYGDNKLTFRIFGTVDEFSQISGKLIVTFYQDDLYGVSTLEESDEIKSITSLPSSKSTINIKSIS